MHLGIRLSQVRLDRVGLGQEQPLMGRIWPVGRVGSKSLCSFRKPLKYITPQALNPTTVTDDFFIYRYSVLRLKQSKELGIFLGIQGKKWVD